MSDFRANILAKLDTSQFDKDIKNLETIEIHFKNVDFGGLDVSKLTKQMESAGASAGTAYANRFSDSMRIISRNSENTIRHMQDAMRSYKMDDSSIRLVTKDLQEMNLEVSKIRTSINGNAMRFNVTGVDQLGNVVSIIKDFDYQSGTITTVSKNIVQSFKTSGDAAKEAAKDINSAFSQLLAKSNEINSLQIRLAGLDPKKNANQYAAISAQIETVTNSYNELYETVGKDLSPEQIQKLADASDKASKKILQMSAAQEDAAKSSEIVSIRSEKLTADIQAFMNANPKAASAYREELKRLKDELSGNFDPQVLTKVNAEFARLKSSAKEAGYTTKTFWQSLKSTTAQVLGLTSGIAVFQKLISLGKEMYQNIYDIDTAMTNLYKVTDETDERYSRFLRNACENAKELGRTVSGLVTQSSEWAKLGYSLDESENLAKVSSIYANVGEVDDSTAVSDMVTAMKAFNIEASDSITIVDALNELGNKFATDAKSLGDGLSRAASSMHVAGASMNEVLAMLTGVTEITQNAQEAGNSLKIFAMRIRGMKGELQELNEEVDPTVDSISKVQTQILNLTKGKVNIFDNTGNFRDYYEIMKEIADLWDSLASTDQASLSEILFGKQRGNQGAALIQSFQSGQIEKAFETATNSAGSAMAEQEKWLNSLEAKTNQLKATFQELSNTVLSSDLFRILIDGARGFLEFLTKIIDYAGAIPVVISGIGISKLIKDFG